MFTLNRDKDQRENFTSALVLCYKSIFIFYQITGKRFGRTRTSQTSVPKGNFQPKEEGWLNLSLPGPNSFRKLREWRADSLVQTAQEEIIACNRI